MHTLFDFITQVKGVEYLVAVSAIAIYLVYWEFLKPKPFRTVIETGKEDLEHVKEKGYGGMMSNVGKIAAAPFIGLAYIVMLPFTFVYALGLAIFGAVSKRAGEEAAFDWRPSEAYLAGKKKEEKEADGKK